NTGRVQCVSDTQRVEVGNRWEDEQEPGLRPGGARDADFTETRRGVVVKLLPPAEWPTLPTPNVLQPRPTDQEVRPEPRRGGILGQTLLGDRVVWPHPDVRR